MPIGAKVTLRGDRMWEFLDRLVSIVAPEDPGLPGAEPRAFDGHGQLHARPDRAADLPGDRLRRVRQVRGMDITIVTTARNDEEGRALLVALGFPLRGPARRSWRRRAERERDEMAKKALSEQAARSKAEVQGPRVHALRAVRPSAGRATGGSCSAALLPRARPRGRDPGGDEGVLVRTAHRTSPIRSPTC